MPVLVNIAADHPCDRCGHASKFHAAPERGSGCQMVEAIGYSVYSKNAQISGKALQCFCDGFFPRP
jgi:hypothetical protein